MQRVLWTEKCRSPRRIGGNVAACLKAKSTPKLTITSARATAIRSMRHGRGASWIAKRAHKELRGALIAKVWQRTAGRYHELPSAIDTVAFTRSRVEPMVRGLFPRAEQETVLAVLAQSVVFVTSTRIEPLLFEQPFDRTAWTLANRYLASLGAELLAHDAPSIVGFSEETTCFVTPLYFAEEDPFADFIVHEAAHIFHNS